MGIDSPDAGTRLTVQDAAGKPLRQWDSRGQTMRWQYDELQRPTHQYVAKGTAEQLVSRIVYDEALDDPNAPTSPSPAQDANLRGQAHLVFDGAGLLKSERLDFKGNLLKASRRLATAYQTTPTWDALASLTAPDAIEQEVDSESLLEAEVFTTEHEYDALNRVTGALLPASGSVHPNLTRPRYNEAGLLDEVRVSVRGATEQLVVKDIEYNVSPARTDVLAVPVG